jgi:hypothetical protein
VTIQPPQHLQRRRQCLQFLLLLLRLFLLFSHRKLRPNPLHNHHLFTTIATTKRTTIVPHVAIDQRPEKLRSPRPLLPLPPLLHLNLVQRWLNTRRTHLRTCG